MKNKKFYRLLSVFCCVIFLRMTISAQDPTETPMPVPLETPVSSETPTATPVPTPTPEIVVEPTPVSIPDPEVNLIHSGDLIDVDVIGSIEYDWRGRLNPEGFLDGIEFVDNPIQALCQTEQSVAEAVSKGYSKFLRDPKVVVRILDRSNRPVSLLYGAVKNPQRLQIKRPVFLNELLIVAGGLTDKASGEIQIYRSQAHTCQQKADRQTDEKNAAGENREKFVLVSQSGDSEHINVKISDLLTGKKEANPQILSGDVITVQEADSIYVIGGVATPKQIFSRVGLTVSRAIDSVGGITKGGDAKNITIFRREAETSQTIEVDLEKIKSGKADDVILKAFDIVDVPQSGREKRKFPPVLKAAEINRKNTINLPLRIIE